MPLSPTLKKFFYSLTILDNLDKKCYIITQGLDSRGVLASCNQSWVKVFGSFSHGQEWFEFCQTFQEVSTRTSTSPRGPLLDYTLDYTIYYSEINDLVCAVTV